VLGDFVDLQLYQRSADVALGVPFNISSYALLLEMIAMECGLIPRYFIHTFGDVHIYLNHMEKLKEQIELPVRNLPKININRVGIFDIGMNDIYLDGYEHGSHIKFDIAV
jgi:thymidylate synthase